MLLDSLENALTRAHHALELATCEIRSLILTPDLVQDPPTLTGIPTLILCQTNLAEVLDKLSDIQTIISLGIR